MYKWIGKGVLRHGELVIHRGETIPDVVSEQTIESLLKNGTAEKISTGGKTPVEKAEGALAKARMAVVKAEDAFESAPDDKAEAIAAQLKKKEEAVDKAAAALEEAIDNGTS